MATTVWIGRAPDDPDPDFAAAASGQLLGTAFTPTTQHLWGYLFRYRAGKSGVTAPTGRAALHRIGSSVTTAEMLGYSAAASLATTMADAASGDWIESAVASVPDGPTNAAIPIPSGTKPLLDMLITGAAANVGMIAAGRLDNPYDVNLYKRSGLSQPPPDPFGNPGTPSPEGQLSIGLACHVNEAPLTPLSRTPGSSDANNPSVINEVTPTFAGDHRDSNTEDGDYMTAFRIEFQRWTGSAWSTVWNPTTNADPAMQASGRFTIDYPSTLTRGDKFRWRCQTADYFGAWGTMSGWLYFNVTNQGFVSLAGNPVSTIQTNQPSFDFSWSHETGLSTNAARIQLYKGNTLVHTSGIIAITVADGASGTLSWASTGLSAAAKYPNGLDWGTTWKYEIQARDSANNWSDYSARRQFKTNASPGIPDSLSPSSSAIRTSRPMLYASVLDIDDTAATGLTMKFEIMTNAGSLISTRVGTLVSYDAVTKISTFGYQTVAGDLATFGTFKFRAYAGDGTLWSGAKTVEAQAIRSAEATFVYANGPTVTVTTPTSGQVFTSSTPTFQWVCATQNRYRVRVYKPGTDDVVYERGWITSTSVKQWTIEAGWLRNNTSYEAEIGCEDTTPLQGFSARIPFSTAYTPPATPTGVSAIPYRIGTDPWPTAILVQAAIAVNSSLFVGRFIYRADLPSRPLTVLTSASDVAFIDPHPRSGELQTYTWRDVYYVDASHTEQIESAGVSVSTVVQLRGTVLSSVHDPVNTRCYLTSVQERSERLRQDKAKVTKWGQKAPTTYYGPGEYSEYPHTVRLLNDGNATALERMAEVRAVIVSHHTLCYRDERGRKDFVQVDSPEFTDVRVLLENFDALIVAENFDEGYFVIETDPGDDEP